MATTSSHSPPHLSSPSSSSSSSSPPPHERYSSTDLITPDQVQVGRIFRREKDFDIFFGTCRAKDVVVSLIKKTITPDLHDKVRKHLTTFEKVRHPNVLLYMGCTTVDQCHLALICEEVTSNFEDVILDPSFAFSLPHRLRLSRDCSYALNWLHSCDPPVIHLDLQPSHIYMDRAGRIKIADFGLTRELNGELHGNPRFESPEVLRGSPATVKSNIFSVGCILLFIVTRSLPYSHYFDEKEEAKGEGEREKEEERREREEEKRRKIKEGILISQLTPDMSALPSTLSRLVAACVGTAPNTRPTMRQVLKVLDVILIDTSIADNTAKKLWRRHFFQRDEVVWKEFESTLWQTYLPSYVYLDTTPRNLQVKQEISKKLNYLHAVLFEMKKIPEGSDFVSMERLGFILQYFGPLLDSNSQALPFLTKLSDVVSEDWFFGALEQAPACSILSTCSKGTYLVRYSTSAPGHFTISLRAQVSNDPMEDFLHMRIKHEPQTSEYSIKGRAYSSLPQLIFQEKINLSLFTPAPSSPFAQLRLAERDLISSGYMN